MYAIYIKFTDEHIFCHKILMAVDIQQVQDTLKRELNYEDIYMKGVAGSTFHNELGEGYFQKV